MMTLSGSGFESPATLLRHLTQCQIDRCGCLWAGINCWSSVTSDIDSRRAAGRTEIFRNTRACCYPLLELSQLIELRQRVRKSHTDNIQVRESAEIHERQRIADQNCTLRLSRCRNFYERSRVVERASSASFRGSVSARRPFTNRQTSWLATTIIPVRCCARRS